MKKYITGFLLISMSISILILFNINKKNNEMLDKMIPIQKINDSLRKTNDSLLYDNISKTIQINRFEYVMDIAGEEMSSDCKDKLDTIMSEVE